MRSGWERARPEDLYGPNDGLEVRAAAARTSKPSLGPYRSLGRAVSHLFLAQNDDDDDDDDREGSYMVQSQPFSRETLHGRLKERPEPSENDRILEKGSSPSNPDYLSHSGRQ